MSEQGSKSRFESCAKRLPALGVVQIPHIPKMPEVKWDIVLGLRNQDDFAAQGVSDADFIEHVGISAGAIADHDPRSVNE